MLRERLGWRRGLCHGPQTSRVILMKVGPKYGKDDPRWHLAHSDAVGRCRQIGTRMWASATLRARRRLIASKDAGGPIALRF
jgi:hypothetical protein